MGYESIINSDSIAKAVANKVIEALNKAKEPIADGTANVVMEGMDRVAKSISNYKLKLNENDIIDIKFNDKKVSKELLYKLSPIVFNINKNLSSVFDFKDSSKTIRSLRSEIGTLYPLSDKLTDSLENAVKAYGELGGTNFSDVSKSLNDFLRVQNLIERTTSKMFEPKDLFNVNNVVSYVDNLKDVIRGYTVCLDLYSVIEKKTKGNTSFFNFDIQNMSKNKKEYETMYTEFYDKVYGGWFGSIRKLSDQKNGVTEKQIKSILNSSSLTNIYTINDSINNTRSNNESLKLSDYIENVAQKYAVDEKTALEKLKRIAGTRKFKGGNYKEVSRDFAGYLNAYLFGGGTKETLEKEGILEDIPYTIEEYEMEILEKEIVSKIEEFVKTKWSVEQAMNILETKNMNI